ILLLLVAVVAAFSPRALAAQTSTTQPSSAELDPPYVDRSFGFTISPPRGGDFSRQKKIQAVADVQLVQFANETQQWSLTIQMTTTTQPLDAAAMSDGITTNLSKTWNDVKMIRSQESHIDSREA